MPLVPRATLEQRSYLRYLSSNLGMSEWLRSQLRALSTRVDLRMPDATRLISYVLNDQAPQDGDQLDRRVLAKLGDSRADKILKSLPPRLALCIPAAFTPTLTTSDLCNGATQLIIAVLSGVIYWADTDGSSGRIRSTTRMTTLSVADTSALAHLIARDINIIEFTKLFHEWTGQCSVCNAVSYTLHTSCQLVVLAWQREHAI